MFGLRKPSGAGLAWIDPSRLVFGAQDLRGQQRRQVVIKNPFVFSRLLAAPQQKKILSEKVERNAGRAGCHKAIHAENSKKWKIYS